MCPFPWALHCVGTFSGSFWWHLIWLVYFYLLYLCRVSWHIYIFSFTAPTFLQFKEISERWERRRNTLIKQKLDNKKRAEWYLTSWSYREVWVFLIFNWAHRKFSAFAALTAKVVYQRWVLVRGSRSIHRSFSVAVQMRWEKVASH